MKKYIYLLKTKPGLARPMINELKNLVQANILMESKSEVKVEMTNIDMLKFLERSFLLEKALIKVKSNLNADTEKSLKISLKKVKFENFLPISKANTYFLPNVIVTSFKSKLFHTKMISNIIRSHIQKISNDSFYFHDKDKEKLTQLSKNEQKLKHTELPSFSVFLEENKMSIFMDFSRKELAKRGYKLVTKGDSLKESIASSLILLSLNEKQILWDPFCGCGTILIEALLQINNVKVRSLSGHDYLRDLKFINECEETLNFLDSAQKSNSNKLELVNKQTNTLKKVYGSDISSLAINATRENFKHASLYEELSINFMENPVIHKERINAITDLYLGDFEKIFGIIIQENFIKTDGKYNPEKKISLISHLPYKLKDDFQMSKKLYNDFGKFLRKNKEYFNEVVLLVNKRDKKDNLNFQVISNLEWKTICEINNEGIDTEIINLKI